MRNWGCFRSSKTKVRIVPSEPYCPPILSDSAFAFAFVSGPSLVRQLTWVFERAPQPAGGERLSEQAPLLPLLIDLCVLSRVRNRGWKNTGLIKVFQFIKSSKINNSLMTCFLPTNMFLKCIKICANLYFLKLLIFQYICIFFQNISLSMSRVIRLQFRRLIGRKSSVEEANNALLLLTLRTNVVERRSRVTWNKAVYRSM